METNLKEIILKRKKQEREERVNPPIRQFERDRFDDRSERKWYDACDSVEPAFFNLGNDYQKALRYAEEGLKICPTFETLQLIKTIAEAHEKGESLIVEPSREEPDYYLHFAKYYALEKWGNSKKQMLKFLRLLLHFWPEQVSYHVLDGCEYSPFAAYLKDTEFLEEFAMIPTKLEAQLKPLYLRIHNVELEMMDELIRDFATLEYDVTDKLSVLSPQRAIVLRILEDLYEHGTENLMYYAGNTIRSYEQHYLKLDDKIDALLKQGNTNSLFSKFAADIGW